ncbi:MAG: hypothetical protein NC935_02250 [Candidatus Omnitrophica bacterium]|nr:hypothetical protein [Candidatus Omnitrophota bacterium]
MFNFFRRKGKLTSSLLKVIEDYLKLKEKDASHTYVIVKYSKKDRNVSFLVGKLEGEIVNINDIAYYVPEKSIYYFDFYLDKKKFSIPLVDVYEGITTSYNPYNDISSEIFSERVQKAIYLYLKTGIMEQKIKQSLSMKKILVGSLIGFVAIYLILKLFS